MNWEKIKETKAYEEWIDFYPYNWDEFTLKEAYPFENLIGWLFRFFDERGIIVEATHDSNEKEWNWFVIQKGKIEADGWGYQEPDRPSALKEGFEKAFEVLNDNIKNAQ